MMAHAIRHSQCSGISDVIETVPNAFTKSGSAKVRHVFGWRAFQPISSEITQWSNLDVAEHARVISHLFLVKPQDETYRPITGPA
jgi:hypothetical protein